MIGAIVTTVLTGAWVTWRRAAILSLSDLPSVATPDCGGDSWAAYRGTPFLVRLTPEDPCLDAAFPGREVEVDFRLTVNQWGLVSAVHLSPGLSPAGVRCLERVASEYLFVPAQRCDGTPVSAEYNAGFGMVRGVGQ